MQVWAIIAQKGGAGKTTLSLHVAIALTQMGKRVHILDVDPQQSAARWGAQRKGKPPAMTPIVAPQVYDVIERLRDKGATDIVIVDTSPRADRESLIVADAADFIIVPARPSALDLPSVEDTLGLLDRAGHVHKAVVVLNAVASSTDEGELAAAYMRTLGPELCPYMLGERVDYRRSLLVGKGVTEAKKSGEAVREITGLSKWMLKKANSMEGANVKKPSKQRV
jgi:chromosome partitioning protein